jgi:hypothetical protein
MSETVKYPIRAVTIDERVLLTYLKLVKPQYAPYLAAIQSVMNQYIVPYAYFGMASTRGTLDREVLDRYTVMAQAKINEALGIFGVAFTLSAQGTERGVKVAFEARKGDNTAKSDHEITGQGPDFGPVYGQSKDIAKARWASYPDMLNEANVRVIFDLSSMGYEYFVLGTNPTPKQQIAALKHRIKLSAVDPAMYIDRVKEAVEKYEKGYEYGVHKYSYAIRWISEGLVAAFKATKTVYHVL